MNERETLVAKVREIIRSAKADLGDDLMGFSAVDLVADNTELPLDTIRELIKEAAR